jgi:uncharacterized membrane protein YcaP (DUF421 family)
MSLFSDVDWSALFTSDTPILEIIVRGSVIYISLFIMLRVILKRQAGTVGITDLLVIVLIADAAQNGMAGDYKSLPDGIILVSTLIFWNYIFQWLGFNYPIMDKIFSPPPLIMVKNGRMILKNMKKELISKEDLYSQLRQQGVENIKEVKQACLEGDGKISVIKYSNQEQIKPKEKIV